MSLVRDTETRFSSGALPTVSHAHQHSTNPLPFWPTFAIPLLTPTPLSFFLVYGGLVFVRGANRMATIRRTRNAFKKPNWLTLPNDINNKVIAGGSIRNIKEGHIIMNSATALYAAWT